MLPGRRAERRLFADRGGAAAGDTHPGWRTAAGKRDFPESWNQNARPCGPFDLGGLFAFLKGLARRGGGPAGGGRVPGLPRAFRFCGKDAGCSPATPPPQVGWLLQKRKETAGLPPLWAKYEKTVCFLQGRG